MAVTVAPPEEVNFAVKLASPCISSARLSIGSTVKVQPSPEESRVTDSSLTVSMLPGSPQVTVSPVLFVT